MSQQDKATTTSSSSSPPPSPPPPPSTTTTPTPPTQQQPSLSTQATTQTTQPPPQSQPLRSANGNLVRTREWHQIKCFHQYLMVRPHQAEWKALHQTKQQWIADMRHYSPSLRHDRAVELFNEHFERVGGADLWRMRFNRRSANPLEWISVDFFSKGRALDPAFLRFLMSKTWKMKTATFQAEVGLEEFIRDRTEDEDKQAKDTFLLAHRFLYDSCPHGLRLELGGGGGGDGDDGNEKEKKQVKTCLQEWEDRGLVTFEQGEGDDAKTVTTAVLAREALDLVTYDSPLLPVILKAMETQRPEAKEHYRRIIAKEANSRTCFFRLYKEARFLTLFGPLAPDVAALIEAAPASYYSSSSVGGGGGGGGSGGGGGGTSGGGSTRPVKRARARGSTYTSFKKNAAYIYTGGSRKAQKRPKKVASAPKPPKYEMSDFYYYDDDDFEEEEEEEEEEEGGYDFYYRRGISSSTAHYHHRHQQQRDQQAWTATTTTAALRREEEEEEEEDGLSPVPAWKKELNDCLGRWFPYVGDAKTLYEPPVDPNDVFEKWCRRNCVSVSALSGPVGRAAGGGVYVPVSVSGGREEKQPRQSDAATSTCTAELMMPQAVSFSSASSVSVATQVGERQGGEEEEEGKKEQEQEEEEEEEQHQEEGQDAGFWALMLRDILPPDEENEQEVCVI